MLRLLLLAASLSACAAGPLPGTSDGGSDAAAPLDLGPPDLSIAPLDLAPPDLSSFACGKLTCNGGQLCFFDIPGMCDLASGCNADDWYSCIAVPAECAGKPLTCGTDTNWGCLNALCPDHPIRCDFDGIKVTCHGI